MKILLYTDVHWAETASIVRGRGQSFSLRLENLIQSVNWAEQQARLQHCDAVMVLGDFFDKPNLTAEEITALTKIEWSNLPHYFLVGNHDANVSDLSFASTFVFQNPLFHIISEPYMIEAGSSVTDQAAFIYLIPYIIEDNRQSLSAYIDSLTPSGNMAFTSRIVLSHNDLAGVRYGQFVSTQGFKVEEILQQCDLFINGHLHNAGFVDESEHILNLGNLSGQNFTEDAYRYRHYCATLDTNNLQLEFFENPHAFNFYRIEIGAEKDLKLFSNLKTNAVVSVQCTGALLSQVKNLIEESNHIVASRVSLLLTASQEVSTIEISQLAQTDYLKQFSDYVLSHVENTEAVQQELQYVLVGGN